MPAQGCAAWHALENAQGQDLDFMIFKSATGPRCPSTIHRVSFFASLAFCFGLPVVRAMASSTVRTLPAATPSTAALPGTAPMLPVKPVASGAYKDSAGAVHHWNIESGHLLSWDGQPYLPVGGVFEPHYWTEGQNDANWSADVAALSTLKQHHVQDVILYNSHGFMHAPAAAVQRVIDYLEQNGFRYGIEVGETPKDPLTGYVIKPNVYRAVPSGDSSAIKFDQINGISSALFVIASKTDDDAVTVGEAVVDETSALVPVPATGSMDSVVLLYPQQVFAPASTEGHLPDLWQGYDDYRDKLLAFFSHIHLCKGFRFFIDPFNDRLGMGGDIPNLVPSSEGFHLAFEAWLQKKYKTADDLNRAWGIKQRDLPDFATAARCLPLWGGLRGVASVYDPVKSVSYGVLNKPTIQSRYWQDVDDFKTTSVRGYMNGIADVLKSAVADVPVVFKAASPDKIFVNDRTVGGFDGLGIEAFGHGVQLETKCAAPVFAMAEESSTNGWLIASDTAASLSTSDSSKAAVGYGSKAEMVDDWNDLAESGARGVFTYALQRLPVDNYKSMNVAAVPDQLGWMTSFAVDFARSSGEASSAIPVLWYPRWAVRENPGIRRLSDGVWWLPSFRGGQVVPLGSKLRAYALDDPNGAIPTYVLWSPHSQLTQVNFTFGKNTHPIIQDPLGNPIKVKIKGGVYTVPVSDQPILVARAPKLPLPLELVTDAEKQADDLVAMADKRKIPIQQYKDEFYYAKNSPGLADEDIQLKFTRYLRLIDALTDFLRPFAWIEGENPARNSFDSLVPNADASNGAYLSLDNPKDPPALDSGGRGYSATYNFTVNAPGRYAIWLAGSRLDNGTASTFTYAVDDGPAELVQDAPAEGTPYGGFAWSDIGEVTLDHPGKHSITVVVNGRRRSDSHYTLAIDTICVTSVMFTPDGTTPPAIDAPPLVAPKTPSDRTGAAPGSTAGSVRPF